MDKAYMEAPLEIGHGRWCLLCHGRMDRQVVFNTNIWFGYEKKIVTLNNGVARLNGAGY